MKNILMFALLLLFTGLISCKDNSKDSKSENDIDAARNFIQSALNGDFDKAKTYMVNDSANINDLYQVQRLSERLTPEEKQKYREASIHIHETRQLNDSASVIIYSNSYKNRIDSLKVVRLDNEWLVDFKYIFRHTIDSLPR